MFVVVAVAVGVAAVVVEGGRRVRMSCGRDGATLRAAGFEIEVEVEAAGGRARRGTGRGAGCR